MFEIFGLTIGVEALQWVGGIAGALIGGRILKWILDKWIDDTRLARWGRAVQNFGYKIGRTVTLGLAGWKYTKGFWNKTIEPYVVLLLELLGEKLISGIIEGLRSDNN